jgi:peptide/nickel transport system substrate-binding protein
MKRKALLIVAVVVLVVLVILNVNRGKPDELVYFVERSPDPLVPILKTNEEARCLCELIFDGLVNKTTVEAGREQYEWALVAEEGYKEEAPWDRFLLTIYLRKGVYWHNGRELTSDDVIYTWEAINQSDSPLRSWLNTFVEWIKPVEQSHYKIKIKLRVEKSKEAFMELFSPVKILPRWYSYQGRLRELPPNLNDGSKIVQEFSFRPIGTGPYKIKERKIRDRVSLVRNGSTKDPSEYKYYLGLPGLKSIRMEVEKNPPKAVRELKKGLALLFDVKQELFNQLVNEPLDYQSYLPYSFYAIVYNTARSPFDDIAFRKAVTCATNKHELGQQYIFAPDIGKDIVINSGVFPRSSGYVQFNPQLFPDNNAFDLTKANQYLRDSNVTEKSFRLLICSQRDGQGCRHLAESYKKMMGAVGINVEFDDVGAPLYGDKVDRRDFDAVFYEFCGFDHFYDIRSCFGTGKDNYSGVRDPELEALLNAFGSAIDWEKLVALTQRIHCRVSELAPACFLFTVPRRAYFSNRLTNVSLHPEVGFSTVERWQLKQHTPD